MTVAVGQELTESLARSTSSRRDTLQTLRWFAAYCEDDIMRSAVEVVAAMLSHPSRKSVSAQAAELVGLVRSMRGRTGVVTAVELGRRLDAMDEVARSLRMAHRRVSVPVPGRAREDRPLLSDAVFEYTAAVRSALAA